MPKQPPKQKRSGPKPRPPNLNDFIRQMALHKKTPTDEDLQALLISLLYDTPTDLDHHSQRGKLKMEIIMALHKINQDKAPPPQGDGDLDAQLLTMLAERQQRKLQDAARQARSQQREGSQDPSGSA